MGTAIRSALCLLLITWQSVGKAADQPGIASSQFVFDEPPVPSCHASTIAETARGTLIAAWFGGKAEGAADVGIWVARRLNGNWTKPIEVVNGVQYQRTDGTLFRHPCWNPVLFQPKNGPLLLFYKVGPSPGKWWGMVTTSDDDGLTWAQPRRLPEHILGPVKNKPVQLANGDLLCPSSSEHDGWRVHFEWTSDLGKTWQHSGPVNDGKEFAAIQPSILMLGGEKLLALGRTRQGKIFQTMSNDLGKSWGAPTATALPNPNAGTDAVTLHDGRHLLVYNHTAKGRSPLNMSVSADGRHWQAALVLEKDPGEYSYPAVIQGADGVVHITYTWQRKKIKHVQVKPNELVLRDMPNGEWPK